MKDPILILWAYFALINFALFCVMGLDKARAVQKRRRIPETSLFLLALAGGSIGGIFGMLAFRHKTRHTSFALGFPLILIAQLGLAVLIIRLAQS